MESQKNNPRITSKDISDLISPSEIEKIGFCEICTHSEGIRQKNYKESITISTEDESYEKLASLEQKKIPSRLMHIELVLKERGFLLANAKLNIIPYPHSTWVYTGNLYKAKKI